MPRTEARYSWKEIMPRVLIQYPSSPVFKLYVRGVRSDEQMFVVDGSFDPSAWNVKTGDEGADLLEPALMDRLQTYLRDDCTCGLGRQTCDFHTKYWGKTDAAY